MLHLNYGRWCFTIEAELLCYENTYENSIPTLYIGAIINTLFCPIDPRNYAVNSFLNVSILLFILIN